MSDKATDMTGAARPLPRRNRKPYEEYTPTDVATYVDEARKNLTDPKSPLARLLSDPEDLENYLQKIEKRLVSSIERAFIKAGKGFNREGFVRRVPAVRQETKPTPVEQTVTADTNASKAVRVPSKVSKPEEIERILVVDKKDELSSVKASDLAPPQKSADEEKESDNTKSRGLMRRIGADMFSTAFPTLSRLTKTVKGAEGETGKEKLSRLSKDIFKTAFPTLSKVIDYVENEKKKKSTEGVREETRTKRSLDKTQRMGEALQSLVTEQRKSVDLLEEMLAVIKGLKKQQGGRSGRFGRMLGMGAALAGTAALGAISGAAAEETPEEEQREQSTQSTATNQDPLALQLSEEERDVYAQIDSLVSSGSIAQEQADRIASEILQGDITPEQARERLTPYAANTATEETPSPIQTPTATQVPGSAEDTNLITPLSSVTSENPTAISGGPKSPATPTMGYQLKDPQSPNPSARAPDVKGDQASAESIAKDTITSTAAVTDLSAVDLVLKARTITFKGDEIELASLGIMGKGSNIQTPGTTPKIQSGGSMGGGSGSVTEGAGSQQLATEQESAADTGSLTFASGVDPRIKKDIAQKVQQIESAFGKKLTITSGFRDSHRNAAAGGARNSAHTRANAVDIQFQGNEEETNKLIEAASAAGIGGIGVYRPGWIHLDTESKRVWGPDFSVRSIPEWSKDTLQAHMTGQIQKSSAGETAAAEPVAASPASPSMAESPSSGGGGEGGGQMESSGSTAAPVPEPTGSEAGAAVMGASQENAVAERTPMPPTVTAVQSESQAQATPGTSVPGTLNRNPNDPGNVEPDDAAERYAKLFNMAA